AELAKQYHQAENYEQATLLYTELIADAADKNRRPPLEAYRALLDIRHKQADDAATLAILSDGLALVPSMELFGEAGKTLVADVPAVERLAAAARAQGNPGEGLTFETAQAV